MSRYMDWDKRLAHFLAANRTRPFRWGEWDCCLFAADAVHAITGHDYAAAYRGKYSTELGAVRALKRYGQGSLAATMDALLGNRVAACTAMRGDVVAVDTPSGDALGVVFNGIWLVQPSGLCCIPAHQAKLCWRVV